MIATQEESTKREQELRREVAELEQMRVNFVDKDKKQRSKIDELTKSNTSLNEEIEMIVTQIGRAFETSFEALVLLDDNRLVQFFNPVAEELFEYSKSEVLGQSFNKLITEDTYRELDENILLYFQTRRKGLIDKIRDTQIINKSGSFIPVQLIMTDFDIGGSRRIAVFMKNMDEIISLQKQRDKIDETLKSKVFDYSTRLELVESFIEKSGLSIPEDIEIQSDLITWSEKYSIELNIIDQQHKKWIEFINILYKSYKTESPKKDILENVSKLLDYTDYLFGFEEKYIEDFKCGNLENHKNEHASFISTIKKHQAQFELGGLDVIYKLIIYLNNWVIKHINNEDKRYVECFKNNGLT
jgi:hemerythrin-like metal-binding protein/PAS domain S-box-containing protein